MTRADRGTVRTHVATLATHAPAATAIYQALAEREIAIAERRGSLTPQAANGLRNALSEPLARPV